MFSMYRLVIRNLPKTSEQLRKKIEIQLHLIVFFFLKGVASYC